MGLFNKLLKNNKADTQARYFIEHRFLPDYFFSERGANLVEEILQDAGEFFVKLYNFINQEKFLYHCPYSVEQFSAEHTIFEDIDGKELHVVQIQMPAPERTPLCEKILLVYDDDFEARRYITVERDDNIGNLICEWQAGGVHGLHSKYSEKEMRSVLGVRVKK